MFNMPVVSLTGDVMRERLIVKKFLKLASLPAAVSSALYCGYAITTPAMAGSWFTLLFFLSGIIAAGRQLMGAYPVLLPRRAAPFALACGIYAVIICISSLAASGQDRILPNLLSYIAFLFVLPMIARIRLSNPDLAFEYFQKFACLGAVLGLAVALFQIYYLKAPLAAGGGGNYGVFGLVMSVLGALSCGWAMGGGWRRVIAGSAGFLAGAAGIMMSDSRTLLPLIVLLPLMAATFAASRKWVPVSVAIALILASAPVWLPSVQPKVTQIYGELANASTSGPGDSMGVRWLLWEASVLAIKEKPWLGWGAQNKMEAVNDQIEMRIDRRFPYRHVHNQALDALVAGGVFAGAAVIAVLLAPLFTVFGRRANGTKQRRFGIISLFLIYGLSSLTGSPFQHDLMLALFLCTNAILLAVDPLTDDIVLRKNYAGPKVQPLEA
jgi:O-antigen ligase